MIGIIFIVQVEPLLKDGDRISNKQVSDVLGQQLVNACTHKSTFQLLSNMRFLQTGWLFISTCAQQLCIDVLIYSQINVVVLLPTGRQVAVD